jgi:hypothetical protein
MGFLENGLLGLALNPDPPDLCLLSSWDYRREPLTLGLPFADNVVDSAESSKPPRSKGGWENPKINSTPNACRKLLERCI